MEQVDTKVTALEVCVSSLEEAESGHANVTTTLQQEVTRLKQDVDNLEQKNPAMLRITTKDGLRRSGGGALN